MASSAESSSIGPREPYHKRNRLKGGLEGRRGLEAAKGVTCGRPNGSYPMSMQILRRLFKTADVSPIAQSPSLPSDWADFSDGLCVLASPAPGGAESRGDKLYSCKDARLIASELNSEWPGRKYRASRATAHEIKAHAVPAARLIARESRHRPAGPRALGPPSRHS
jgi:hypothetical protein